MLDTEDKETYATVDAVVCIVSAMAESIQNPGFQSEVTSVATQQKVAASVRKHLAKHMVRKEG